MRLLFSTTQWGFFILTGSLVAPVVVAAAFHLNDLETVGLLQRTFIVVGLSSILQALLGHKLPILEGPAGVWWGVFILLANNVSAAVTTGSIMQSLEMGLLFSGLLLMSLSFFNVLNVIKKWFTPAVTGTYLLLLIFQFSASIVKGMLGISLSQPHINFKVALLAILTLIVTIYCGRCKYRVLQSYSILFGVAFGFALFSVLGLKKSIALQTHTWFTWPKLFAWGPPSFDIGMLLTAAVITLLLLINLIASIVIVEKAVQRKAEAVYNKAGIVMGVNQMLSAVFSAVGCVANSHTAGFISATQMTKRLPFILGCLAIILVGFFPPITVLLASIPTPVAFAVILYPFSHLLAAGLREYESSLKNQDQMFVITLSLIMGTGSMFIPAAAIADLNPILRPIVNNGLVIGVITAILLEQSIKIKSSISFKKQQRRSVYAANDKSIF